MTNRRFASWLGAVALAALVVRVAYVLVERRDVTPMGDASFYHLGANLLADGKGFIVPLQYVLDGRSLAAADHPPLYLAWLALPSLVGLDTPVSHMLWSTLLGTGTVVLVGLVGRRVAGPRAGVVAAAIAALYPNVWSHDGMIQAETIAMFAAMLAVLLAYRYRERPSAARAVWLGLACGCAALSRSELLLLVPLLVLPLVLRTRPVDLRMRIRWLLTAGLAALVPIAPWVAYNLTRFEHPVYLSSGFEVTLLTASCDTTYYGRLTGYWSQDCGVETPRDFDQSEKALAYRDAAVDYIGGHLGRVPVVVGARWGRIAGVFRPAQQVDLDHFVEGRDLWVARTAQVMWYPIAVLAMIGAVVLRRRRDVPLLPLAALPAIVLVSVTVTFATHRYRAIAEPALAVLAAVAIDAGMRHRVDRRRAPVEAVARLPSEVRA